MVTIAGNRNTGNIDHYSGPSFDIEIMSEVPAVPAISENEARKLFNDHLDFELAWKKDYDSETDPYILAYEACNRKTKTAIQYVDAMTGEIISSRDY